MFEEGPKRYSKCRFFLFCFSLSFSILQVSLSLLLNNHRDKVGRELTSGSAYRGNLAPTATFTYIYAFTCISFLVCHLWVRFSVFSRYCPKRVWRLNWVAKNCNGITLILCQDQTTIFHLSFFLSSNFFPWLCLEQHRCSFGIQITFIPI